MFNSNVTQLAHKHINKQNQRANQAKVNKSFRNKNAYKIKRIKKIVYSSLKLIIEMLFN
jgi:hypothetical protein